MCSFVMQIEGFESSLPITEEQFLGIDTEGKEVRGSDI